MIKKIVLVFFPLLAGLNSNCQKGDEYQVYALQYYETTILNSAGWSI